MLKRLTLLILLVAALLAGCDSEDTIATVTARVRGTSTAAATLTAIGQITPSRTPTRTPTPSRTPLPTATGTPTTPPTETPVPTQVSLSGDVVWFGESIYYLLFVRSFRDSDGDGIGDLQGVIDGLDYLQDLGVTGLWLMPVFESPSYHGYDTTDYYRVNPDYGTNEDLQRLIEAVHGREMTILLDLAFNHTSDQHPFFRDAYGNPESEYAGWYRWRNPEQTRYDSFAGVQSMPRLNFEHSAVRQYAIEVALHWIDPNGDGDFADGADGFRLDVATGLPRSFLAELRAALDARNPRALLLGELWTEGAQIARYLQGDGLNAAFDFPTYMVLTGHHDGVDDGVLAGVGDPSLVGLNMRSLTRLISESAFLVRFTNNHDTNRVMSDVSGDMARARAAAVWLLTAPGIPMLYYGEEIGMRGVKGAGSPYWDEFRREPMDWYAAETGPGMTTWFRPADRNNAPNDGVSVEEQMDDPASLLSFYRDLARLRLEAPAMRRAAFDLLRQNPLYVLRRWDEDALYIVAINFTREPLALDDLAALREIDGMQYDSDSRVAVTEQGVTSSTDGSITFAPAGYAIYRMPRVP